MFATIGAWILGMLDIVAPAQVVQAIGLFAILFAAGILIKVLPDRISDLWEWTKYDS